MTQKWSIVLKPDQKWSGIIGGGKYVRFQALGDKANVSTLLYNALDKTERYNMPDTLKGQHTAHLTVGDVLLSDNGRVLAGIVEDSLGWHDTISGHTLRRETDEKYGATCYQTDGNEMYRCGEENFRIELIRNGLSVRDLMPCVNLFAKVYCEEDGSMHFDQEHCKAGATVTLRTEMDVLFIFSNTPNPLDESTVYAPGEVRIEVYDAPPVDFMDVCVNKRPENNRAYQNTWEYFELMGR